MLLLPTQDNRNEPTRIMRCTYCSDYFVGGKKELRGRGYYISCSSCFELYRFTESDPEFIKRARAVGIQDEYDWPYGPNIDPHSRVELLMWAEENGLKQSHASKKCLHFLIKKNSAFDSCYTYGEGCRPIDGYYLFDHLSIWNRNGKPACVVTHPYSERGIHEKFVRELKELEEEKGVTVRAYRAGWYRNGTMSYEYWAPGLVESNI